MQEVVSVDITPKKSISFVLDLSCSRGSQWSMPAPAMLSYFSLAESQPVILEG